MKNKYEILKEQVDVLRELYNKNAASPYIHENSYVTPVLKSILDEYVDKYETELVNELESTTYLFAVARGSRVYGTYEKGVSDTDYLVVVPDSFYNLLSQYPRHIFEYKDKFANVDYQFVCEKDFIAQIEKHDIAALECIFSPTLKGDSKGMYQEYFKLDKWKLRESVSAVCSNSWVKAKKKLTVEKDYDLRIGQKSLWHSMRIYMFAIQIAQTGKIYDYSCANDLWWEIKSAETPTWDYYKEKYQEKFNNLRSELVKLCPKPVE